MNADFPYNKLYDWMGIETLTLYGTFSSSYFIIGAEIDVTWDWGWLIIKNLKFELQLNLQMTFTIKFGGIAEVTGIFPFYSSLIKIDRYHFF